MSCGLACYETKAIALRVRTQPTEMSCVEVADRVFAAEGFVAAPGISGTDRVYTPRASATTAMALRWGISVLVKDEVGAEKWGPCTFDLQALSADEGCGLQCPLTPQPGFDDVTRKMATLLAEAFKGRNQAGGD
jgi:hypothetical protein